MIRTPPPFCTHFRAYPSLVAVLVCVLGTRASAQQPDRVHLKSGKVVVGKITKREKSRVRVLVGGKSRALSRRSILKITDADGHIRWEDAYTIRTKHYVIETNVDRKHADLTGERLEVFRAWFFQNFKKAWKLHKVKRMGVKLFRTRTEFEAAYHRVTGKGGRAPGGFYFSGDETLYVTKENRSARFDLAQNALYHEGGHQILNLSANLKSVKRGRARHWVNEGIPCYFEALRIEQGKPRIGTNRNRLLQALAQITQGEHRPLPEFDALTRKDYGVREYAQGYALAHFFMAANGGKYRQPFLEFARDVFFTRDRKDGFERRFGRSIASFEAEWKTWVATHEQATRKRKSAVALRDPR